ncbi:MAG: alpha-L-rhamnosidase N-terminal domain-containing protein, partial [Bacteroidota bacterium]
MHRCVPSAASVLLLVVMSAHSSAAQWELQPVFDEAPPAWWISHPTADGNAFGVFHFRKTLQVASPPDRFVVHISADNRYRLYVNGQEVSAGPQRSDLMHWRYETVDLAPHLAAGDNVIAALVWNWGPHRPVAQQSHRTAFLLQGNSEKEAVVNTDRSWKVWHNAGYAAIPVEASTVGGYYAAPPGEALEARHYPWGWKDAAYDEGEWHHAATNEGWSGDSARLRGTHLTGEAGSWQLVARTIPQMEVRPTRFASIRRTVDIPADDAFLRGEGDLVIPPNRSVSLLLDHGSLTNAYPVLEVTGGRDAQLSLTYAEALRDVDGNKGHRDEVEGKTISGVTDRFSFDGGERRGFQTLWFRTYRYVQLDIETRDEPLRIHDLHGLFTGYPFEERARFSSDEGWLSDMWEVNWRTARLCAEETYFDTPYYEQLQYVGDTRIQ